MKTVQEKEGSTEQPLTLFLIRPPSFLNYGGTNMFRDQFTPQTKLQSNNETRSKRLNPFALTLKITSLFP